MGRFAVFIILNLFALSYAFYSKNYRKCKLFNSNKFDLGSAKL